MNKKCISSNRIAAAFCLFLKPNCVDVILREKQQLYIAAKEKMPLALGKSITREDNF